MAKEMIPVVDDPALAEQTHWTITKLRGWLVFQLFPDFMAMELPAKSGKKVILVLDNPSLHNSKCLNWHHIRPLHLPPYSPDFNPIKRFWQHL